MWLWGEQQKVCRELGRKRTQHTGVQVRQSWAPWAPLSVSAEIICLFLVWAQPQADTLANSILEAS